MTHSNLKYVLISSWHH